MRVYIKNKEDFMDPENIAYFKLGGCMSKFLMLILKINLKQNIICIIF